MILGIYHTGYSYMGGSGGSFSETFDVIDSDIQGPTAVVEEVKPLGVVSTRPPLMGGRPQLNPTGLTSSRAPRAYTGRRGGFQSIDSALCDDLVALCDDPDELAGQYVEYTVQGAGVSVRPNVVRIVVGEPKPSVKDRSRKFMGSEELSSALCDDLVVLCDDPDELAGQYIDYSIPLLGGFVRQDIINSESSNIKPRGVVSLS